MKINDEMEAVRPLTVEMPDSGQKVHLTYRSGKYTGSYLDSLSDKSGTQMLAEMVVSWDITEEIPDPNSTPPVQEIPFVITEENIERLPIRILHTLTGAIHEDTRPKPKKEKNSGDTW